MRFYLTNKKNTLGDWFDAEYLKSFHCGFISKNANNDTRKAQDCIGTGDLLAQVSPIQYQNKLPKMTPLQRT